MRLTRPLTALLLFALAQGAALATPRLPVPITSLVRGQFGSEFFRIAMRVSPSHTGMLQELSTRDRERLLSARLERDRVLAEQIGQWYEEIPVENRGNEEMVVGQLLEQLQAMANPTAQIQPLLAVHSDTTDLVPLIDIELDLSRMLKWGALSEEIKRAVNLLHFVVVHELTHYPVMRAVLGRITFDEIEGMLLEESLNSFLPHRLQRAGRDEVTAYYRDVFKEYLELVKNEQLLAMVEQLEAADGTADYIRRARALDNLWSRDPVINYTRETFFDFSPFYPEVTELSELFIMDYARRSFLNAAPRHTRLDLGEGGLFEFEN